MELQRARAYIDYRRRARTRHGVHSPFVYRLIEEVFKPRKFSRRDELLELRRELRNNRGTLKIRDHGAGSRVHTSDERRIRDIVKVSTTSLKDAGLLQRLGAHLQCRRILELGTNLGLTTAALAATPAVEKVISIEGDPGLAALARHNLSRMNLRAEILTGTFEECLEPALDKLGTVDLAYIDGNHRRKPTLAYFNKIADHCTENSVIIVGDIHWSAEMEAAWEEIKKYPGARMTIDLFSMGCVFFRKELSPQHFTIYYR